MKAAVITGVGGSEVVEIREVPTPTPEADWVRVRVRGASLNRADLMQARGHYPAPPGAPSEIPGLEFAGEVDAVGPLCTGTVRPGDRVCGIVGGGGLAEYVVTHERLLAPVPERLDWVGAAAVPEAFLTAFDAIENQAATRPGEMVLIHAVGSGIGTAAVQIARAMGCPTIGTARSGWKLERAKELGLETAIDTSAGAFAAKVRETTGGVGVPVILDHVGGSTMAENLESLAFHGRIVVIGLLGGGKAEVDLRRLMDRRGRIVGTTLRSRPLEQKIALTQEFARRVVPWFEAGRLRPVVDTVFPLGEIRKAMERMASNAGFGRIVLTMDRA